MAMVFCDWAFGLINGAGIFYVTAVGGFNNAMLCNIQGFFALQLGCGSIITVGSIAVERYWMIVKVCLFLVSILHETKKTDFLHSKNRLHHGR